MSKRDSDNLADLVGLGVHPDVSQEQARFLALWNDMQNVLWSRSEILLSQKNEVIIGSADVVVVTFLSRNYFLLQDGDYDLFTSRATLGIGDFECLDVRGSEADLSSYFRGRLSVVAPE